MAIVEMSDNSLLQSPKENQPSAESFMWNPQKKAPVSGLFEQRKKEINEPEKKDEITSAFPLISGT